MAKSDSKPANKGVVLSPRDSDPGPATESVPQVPAVPAVPPPPEVMNAADLVERILGDMLSLRPVRPLLSRVAALLSYKQMGVPVEEAIAELDLANISLRTITPGIGAMIKAADEADLALVREFNEKVGEGRLVKVDDMNPGPAKEAELKEHADNRQKAAALLGRAQPLLTAIFAVEDKGGVAGWFRKAVDKVDELTLVKPEESPAEFPGWQTAPKLNESIPAVKALLGELRLIESTYARVRDPKKALAQLANLNIKFTAERVRFVLDSCVELANAQVAQSAKAEGVAEADTAAFVAKAQKNDSVREIAQSAQNYLDSAKK